VPSIAQSFNVCYKIRKKKEKTHTCKETHTTLG
jgi:hypothetical protein